MLPATCAIGIDDRAGALIIHRGEPGFKFWPTVVANHWNANLSVSAPQVSAMLLGAVTGWHTPYVDDALFDMSTGLFIAPMREVTLCAYWCAARGLTGHADGDSRLPIRLSLAARAAIRERRQAFMAQVRWRSFAFDEQMAAEEAFQ